jgi:TRAP-type uncharacterized transport system substrate-binding protein
MNLSAIRTFVAAAFALTLPGLAWAQEAPPTGQNWPKALTIGTASPGGTYHSYGEGLAKILSRDWACLHPGDAGACREHRPA